MLPGRINRVFDCRDGMSYHPSNRRIQGAVFGTPRPIRLADWLCGETERCRDPGLWRKSFDP